MHPLQQGDGKEGGAAAAQLGWGEVPSYRQAVLGDLLELWPRKALPHEYLERHLDPASSPKSVTLSFPQGERWAPGMDLCVQDSGEGGSQERRLLKSPSCLSPVSVRPCSSSPSQT